MTPELWQGQLAGFGQQGHQHLVESGGCGNGEGHGRDSDDDDAHHNTMFLQDVGTKSLKSETTLLLSR
jgi:hypothetical protein